MHFLNILFVLLNVSMEIIQMLTFIWGWLGGQNFHHGGFTRSIWAQKTTISPSFNTKGKLLIQCFFGLQRI